MNQLRFKHQLRMAVPGVLAAAAIILAACGAPAAPAAPAAEATAAAPGAPVVNRAGVTLPADAAPLDKQVMYMPAQEQKYMTWDASVYSENVGDNFAWADSCVRPNKDFEPQPNACASWSVSDDGLTMTFHLREGVKWHDGVAFTSKDVAFTLEKIWKALITSPTDGFGEMTVISQNLRVTPSSSTTLHAVFEDSPDSMSTIIEPMRS